MAPKTSARGLELSAAAAPVLWGGLLEPVGDPVGFGLPEAEAVRERVAEEMVLLAPAEGKIEAEAATLEMAAEADEAAEEAAERALETAAEADERADEAEATAEETALDPPVRGNWPE